MPLLSVTMDYMSLEHFADGAGEAVHMLGATKWVSAESQKPRLYKAEGTWRQNLSGGGKTVSRQGARDLVGEAVFHPAMDDLPGIEGLRAGFSPEKNVKFFSDSYLVNHPTLPPSTQGFHANGVIALRRDPNNEPNTTTGIVTHETAHLLGKQFFSENPLEAHSWPMARLHIHVTRQLLGDRHAHALKRHYESLGVDYGGKAI